MVRIFMVDCPACGETFHGHHGELMGTGVRMLCPTCGERFLPEESPNLRE